ncbi:hypothetical protein EYF80_058646 [Liparis tanakae]|uniref:Uncharacterized protein n=1 Tax=Liparis tanakae TaxID=230148 RepID=A0A4Z2ESE7_9TELE|nr:hypothetical protein EYF80_058646 [Liparis tanakae]
MLLCRALAAQHNASLINQANRTCPIPPAICHRRVTGGVAAPVEASRLPDRQRRLNWTETPTARRSGHLDVTPEHPEPPYRTTAPRQIPHRDVSGILVI